MNFQSLSFIKNFSSPRKCILNARRFKIAIYAISGEIIENKAYYVIVKNKRAKEYCKEGARSLPLVPHRMVLPALVVKGNDPMHLYTSSCVQIDTYPWIIKLLLGSRH